MARHVHPYAMGLHDRRSTIDINNESWQVVALAVDQSEGVVLRIVCHSDAATSVQRHLNTAAPEGVIDGFVGKREHAHGDAANLPVAYSD